MSNTCQKPVIFFIYFFIIILNPNKTLTNTGHSTTFYNIIIPYFHNISYTKLPYLFFAQCNLKFNSNLIYNFKNHNDISSNNQ